MARKVYCENARCKNLGKNDACSATVRIGPSGRCESFTKGFNHYVFLVWDALEKSNYIDFIDINRNPDLRIGIYYVCKLFHVIFSEMEWGTCRMLTFHKEEKGPALRREEIVALGLDEAEFDTLYKEFMAGRLPGPQRPVPEPEKTSQPFGWLSPMGDFLESDFGTHEEEARRIINAAGFQEECLAWKREDSGRLCRDFLENVKGYVLIHNPSGNGGYIVSATKQLTKNQREFLYDYFMEIGDRFKAEQYLEEKSVG